MKKIKFCSYQEASEYAQQLGMTSSKQWRQLRRKDLPKHIPTNPESHYRGAGWVNWYAFLGIDKYASYEDAKLAVKQAGIKSSYEYRMYGILASEAKLPANPNVFYSNQWEGWPTFLGVQKVKFVTYDEAKQIVRNLHISTSAEWRNLTKAARPPGVPSNPREYYYHQWEGWSKFLGRSKGNKFLSYEEAKDAVKPLKLRNASAWTSLDKRPPGVPSNPRTYYQKTNDWKGWDDFLSTHN